MSGGWSENKKKSLEITEKKKIWGKVFSFKKKTKKRKNKFTYERVNEDEMCMGFEMLVC